MEIMRETPRSRIREQNRVYKCWQWEFNGQCSGGDNCSFRHDINKRGKMTQSNTSPNSFMQQNERKASRTRSPRGRSPSGRMYRWPCKDYVKGTCNNSFCEKWHPPECLFYMTKSGCRFEEKCSYPHRQVDEQPGKRSKKNDDKSAVAMLKKNDWHENVREPVVNHAKGHDRSGRPDKKSWSWVETRTYWTSIIERTTIGLCISRHEAAEVYSLEELRHAETNPTCEIHEGYCTSHSNSRPKSFAQIYLPRWNSSAQPERSKIRGSVSGRDRVARARCPRSSVEAGQKCVQIKRAWKSSILLVSGK